VADQAERVAPATDPHLAEPLAALVLLVLLVAVLAERVAPATEPLAVVERQEVWVLVAVKPSIFSKHL